MHTYKNLIYILSFYIFFGCSQNEIVYENGAIPPEEGLLSYEVPEGFQIELFASEPLIMDPVDMAVDEFGRVYVAEMSGYPLDKSHTGKIKLLKDTDGDGVMDKSIIFAEELMFPNGLLPWKKGLIVTDAPYVIYLEDVDGDGRADIRDTILTGFSLSNPHVNVNNPIYGLDNWIYLSHFGRIGTRKYEDEFGDEGEEIRFWNQQGGPFLPKNADSKNVRFKPDGKSLEMLSVKGQFGHAFDDWGHHFLTHNQNHIYQEVLAPQYMHRNPNAVITTGSEDVSDHGNSTEVFQITTNPDRQLFSDVGLTTSTGGLTYYSGGIFPPPYDENVTFVTESVSNLVHADHLVSKGATFSAERIESGKEFLASTDYWARPVNMYVGPDGALYVLDYYRRVIEHPEWMSDKAIEAGDLYDGHNMGRIYRISPKGTSPAEWTTGLDLGQASDTELVDYLSDNNRWWRSHAQRLLVDRKESKVIPMLKLKLKEDDSELGRLHALWTLEGMEAIESDDIIIALNDASAGVRENAIIIAEEYLEKWEELRSELLKMTEDSSAKVRFQLLCTLGDLEGHKAKSAREKILFNDIEDVWVQRAALSAKEVDVEGLLKKSLQLRKGDENSLYDPFISFLAEILGSGQNRGMIASLLKRGLNLQSSDPMSLRAAILGGLTSGLQRNENKKEIVAPEENILLRVYEQENSKPIRNFIFSLLGFLKTDEIGPRLSTAIQTAMDKSQDRTLEPAYRSDMLKMVLLADPTAYETEVKDLIQPDEDPLIQKMGLEVYSNIPGTAVSDFVLDNWEKFTPDIRDVALQSFMGEKDRVILLLDALENGKVQKVELGWPRTVQLNSYPEEDIRKRARSILAEDDLEEVIASYSGVFDMKGDIEKGYEVFKTHCSLCHQMRGKGDIIYGPDLGTVHNWEGEALLANILDPGLSIAPGFDVRKVELKNGEILQGMIIDETSSAIVLSVGPGSEQTVIRQEIKNMESVPGLSMMPGFGGVLSIEEMADLIHFLRNSSLVE